MKFSVEIEMKDRWVPHFLGMLATMEALGNVGASRIVALYADGDGDYHPKFKWNADVEPTKRTEEPLDEQRAYLFDAG